MSSPKNHILIIRLSAMGDCALVVPVLLRFQKQYPDFKISVVTKAFFKPIFEVIPGVEILVADTDGEHKGFWGVVKLGFHLKKQRFTHVADLHQVLRSKIIRFILKSARVKSAKINKGRKDKKALTRSRHKVFKALKTTPERYADVFNRLGLPVDLHTPAVLEKPALSTPVKELLGESGQNYVGIAPFAAHPPKTYPLDLMENIIQKLNSTNNYKIFLFGGGKKETKLLTDLAQPYKNTVAAAGKLSFKEEIGLIAQMDLLLSMDSGNGHLAAMFGIPVITIWGATHPYAGFAPFNQPDKNQFIPDLDRYPLLPTSVFGNKQVKDYEDVMRSIPPQEIVTRMESLLKD